MSSIIEGYNYDIFISYRQKDNKGDRWVSEFVEALKTELESTFKEEIGVYFDINPHDGLLETHDVDASLKDKLKCLVFIPIISRTYCDPKSFAWEHEFKAFVEQASQDQFGLKVKLPNGNVSSRVLPVRIYDLDTNDIKLCESILGGVLRSVEFIYKEHGVNRPLRANEDDPHDNLNHTIYRNQINKVANSIKEIITAIGQYIPQKEEVKKEVFKSISLPRKSNKTKIITATVIVLALIVLGYFLIPTLSKPKKQLEKSIAVLPFVNDSPDKENEYLCNGMMEDILNQFQKINDLKVKSRTSVEKYRNSDKDIKKIGYELGVSLIMEGSVRRIGDDLRIAAQLIDAKTGDHLWSEIYDGKYTTEIFKFQSNVAKRVAASLNAVITPQEVKRMNKKPTAEMQAYDLCTRGYGMLQDKWIFTLDSLYLKLALNLFDQALAIDPKYIDALDGKGWVYRDSGRFDSAMVYYKKVLKIDPENAEVMSLIGVCYTWWNKLDSAYKYLQKGIDLWSNDPYSYENMGEFLFLKKNEVIEALPYFQKAYDLGGTSDWWIDQNIANVYFQIGDYQKSLKYIKIALSLRSECPLISQYGYILSVQRKYDETLHFLDSICSITPCESICDIIRFYLYTNLKEFEKAEKFYNNALNSGYKPIEDWDIYIAFLYKETGRKNKTVAILNKSIRRNENLLKENAADIWSSQSIKLRLAAAYALLTDNKKALYYLSELEKTGIIEWPCTIRIFPGFDYLRDNLEFKAIVKCIEDQRAAIREKVKGMEQRGEINL